MAVRDEEAVLLQDHLVVPALPGVVLPVLEVQPRGGGRLPPAVQIEGGPGGAQREQRRVHGCGVRFGRIGEGDELAVVEPLGVERAEEPGLLGVRRFVGGDHPDGGHGQRIGTAPGSACGEPGVPELGPAVVLHRGLGVVPGRVLLRRQMQPVHDQQIRLVAVRSPGAGHHPHDPLPPTQQSGLGVRDRLHRLRNDEGDPARPHRPGGDRPRRGPVRLVLVDGLLGDVLGLESDHYDTGERRVDSAQLRGIRAGIEPEVVEFEVDHQHVLRPYEPYARRRNGCGHARPPNCRGPSGIRDARPPVKPPNGLPAGPPPGRCSPPARAPISPGSAARWHGTRGRAPARTPRGAVRSSSSPPTAGGP